jgi:hypothetical protein
LASERQARSVWFEDQLNQRGVSDKHCQRRSGFCGRKRTSRHTRTDQSPCATLDFSWWRARGAPRQVSHGPHASASSITNDRGSAGAIHASHWIGVIACNGRVNMVRPGGFRGRFSVAKSPLSDVAPSFGYLV